MVRRSRFTFLPDGKITAQDGRKFVLANASAVVNCFNEGKADLPVDYEHQVGKRTSKDVGPVPAAGWIKELAARLDGLWGRVDWTARAARMIRDCEYRYLSPSMLFDKETLHVMRLKGAGLVHRPALHLAALASQENEMDGSEFMQSVADFLGLAKRRKDTSGRWPAMIVPGTDRNHPVWLLPTRLADLANMQL